MKTPAAIHRLLDRLLIIEDDAPEMGLHRRWRWGPSVSIERWGVAIGVVLHLIQANGQPLLKKYPVQWFHLQLRPTQWRWGQIHVYYDGAFCCYQFGPVWIDRHWGWCEKCRRE